MYTLFTLLLLLQLSVLAADVSIAPNMSACADQELTAVSEIIWKFSEQNYWSFVSLSDIDKQQMSDLVERALKIGLPYAKLDLLSKAKANTNLTCSPLYISGDDVNCSPPSNIPTAPIQYNELTDHVVGSEPLFILHGAVEDVSVRAQIRKLIDSKTSFAFRPFIRDCNQKLSIKEGFGMSMEVRSEMTADAVDLFDKSLLHLRKHLKEPSEYKMMGLKTIQAILQSSDPFTALTHASTNYPLYKKSLSRVQLSLPMAQYMGKINQLYPHDVPFLYINGLEAQPEILDAYSINELLLLLEKHKEENVDLMSSWSDRSLPRFHIPLNMALTIINDLETDSRYSKWPKTLKDLFRPSRSIIKQVALNLVTCIVVIDFSKPLHAADVINNVLELAEQNIPIRFSILPTHLTEKELSYYYGILANFGLSEAIRFICRKNQTAEEYAKEHPRIRTVAFLERCAGHKDAVKALADYKLLVSDFDIDKQDGHLAIVNGIVVKLNGNDAYEDSVAILKTYQSEIKAIQKLVYEKELTDSTDYYNDIFTINKDNVMTRSNANNAPFLDDKSQNVDAKSVPINMQKLAERYNEILLRHLPKEIKSRNVLSKQQQLMKDLKDHMRALFPVIEPATPISRAFMAPILFGDEAVAPLKLTVLMNPVSAFAQRLLSLLQYYGPRYIHCKIYLMAPAEGAERDFNSFYNFAGIKSIMPSKLNFTFALQPDCPAGWALTVASSNVDLDNVKSTDGVKAVYRLESLTVEGSVVNKATGGAAAGQLVSLSDANGILGNSIVMGNYGYYQLSTRPGVYTVNASGISKRIIVDRLDSILLDRIKVEQVEKLQTEESDNHTINVFSIASGYNYEQLLRIMMLSAVKNTKHKLVFWLIDSLVSPDLRRSLDVLCQKYHFEVRFVHYKWPSWLNKQTSRMRTVWAYKILFLDVLFPLDLDRILFVDADQVIRSDLYDLYSIDMQDHVYGFTAFCDSRKEADGYRFWKSGYWRDFLQGRPYHISAMFLVDLKRLRSTLTADLLRGQYQILSRDPESLSNLDQDLPNHLQHRIPIFTLPKDWLWCESWCSDEDKERAKIIDLCSNPARAESKLDSAMRIIPEWKALNEQVLVDITTPDEHVEL